MNKDIKLVVVTVVSTISLLAALAVGEMIGRAQTAPVTLINPGLEGEYTPWNNVGELKVPGGYEPWDHDDTRRPEYLAGDVARTGKALKIFSTYGEQDAGLFQEVYGVTPGQWYKFSAWVHYRSIPAGNKMSAMVCANPWGDNRVTYRTTVCGKEVLNEPGKWLHVSVTFQAWTDKITVSTRGVAEYPYEYSDFFWDDLSLEPVTVGSACPTPVPCATVGPCPTAGVPGECATLTEIEGLLRGMAWGVQ